MTHKILFVDDDPHVLTLYERALGDQFVIETASRGEAALGALDANGPFAVIVSDLNMPGMNGIQLLALASRRAPDAVRMLITGHADLQCAIQAVNDGHVFRFLTKPCPVPALTKALEAGLAQHRLITAEKELLEKTLRGSVKVLGEVLALVSPLAFGRAVRVQGHVREILAVLGTAGDWATEVAALLSQIGCVTVPEAVLAKAYRAEPLAPAETRMLDAHPAIGGELLRAIPRLEAVADTIAAQNKRFDGGSEVPPGARLLKVALDFDALLSQDLPRPVALKRLKAREGWYDPAVLAALEEVIRRDVIPESRVVAVRDLAPGMILAADLYSQAGALLLTKGHVITGPIVSRLQNIFAGGGLSHTVPVLVPRGVASPPESEVPAPIEVVPRPPGGERPAAPSGRLPRPDATGPPRGQ
jgi:response regulator RpfG family c-di-GMP phosphodiesterase